MKKIYLLINGRATGPYEQEILSKFDLEKDLKIRFENEKKWMSIEEFLKVQNSLIVLDEKDVENKKIEPHLNLIRVKDKKVKHIRNSISYIYSRFFRKYEKTTMYIVVCLIGIAVIMAYFYLRYQHYSNKYLF